MENPLVPEGGDSNDTSDSSTMRLVFRGDNGEAITPGELSSIRLSSGLKRCKSIDIVTSERCVVSNYYYWHCVGTGAKTERSSTPHHTYPKSRSNSQEENSFLLLHLMAWNMSKKFWKLYLIFSSYLFFPLSCHSLPFCQALLCIVRPCCVLLGLAVFC